MLRAMGFFSRIFGRRSQPVTPPPSLDLSTVRTDWIVVGLGNPGARYAATRHNVGYMAVDDLLAPGGDVLLPVPGYQAAAALIQIDGHDVLVLRSTTFMNLSGEAVGPVAAALGVAPDHVICLHDELDLPAHTVRLKLGGNENGHNGLKSLTEHLGTQGYLRVRIGIARPPKGSSISDYVLGPVDAGRDFDAAIALAADAVRRIVTDGLSKAQNAVHSH